MSFVAQVVKVPEVETPQWVEEAYEELDFASTLFTKTQTPIVGYAVKIASAIVSDIRRLLREEQSSKRDADLLAAKQAFNTMMQMIDETIKK